MATAALVITPASLVIFIIDLFREGKYTKRSRETRGCVQLALTLSLSVAIPFGAATVLYLAMLLTVMVARELRGYTRKRAYIPLGKEKGEESWVWYVFVKDVRPVFRDWERKWGFVVNLDIILPKRCCWSSYSKQQQTAYSHHVAVLKLVRTRTKLTRTYIATTFFPLFS